VPLRPGGRCSAQIWGDSSKRAKPYYSVLYACCCHPHVTIDLLKDAYSGSSGNAKAEPLYQEALRIRQKVLGSEHPDTVTSLEGLALCEFELLYPHRTGSVGVYLDTLSVNPRSVPQPRAPSHGAPDRGGPCGGQTALRATRVLHGLHQADRGTGILSHGTKFVMLQGVRAVLRRGENFRVPAIIADTDPGFNGLAQSPEAANYTFN
jgi:hypothetical protein